MLDERLRKEVTHVSGDGQMYGQSAPSARQPSAVAGVEEVHILWTSEGMIWIVRAPPPLEDDMVTCRR